MGSPELSRKAQQQRLDHLVSNHTSKGNLKHYAMKLTLTKFLWLCIYSFSNGVRVNISSISYLLLHLCTI